jgi:hypothetical protein
MSTKGELNDQRGELKLQFLAEYVELRTIRGVAKKLKLGHATLSKWLMDDEVFKAQLNALREYLKLPEIDDLEDKLRNQGLGIGESLTRAQMTALIARLKALKPEVYIERAAMELSGKGGTPIEVKVVETRCIDDSSGKGAATQV